MHRFPWLIIVIATFIASSIFNVALIDVYPPIIFVMSPLSCLAIAEVIHWMAKRRAQERLQLRGHRWIVSFFAGLTFLFALAAWEFSVRGIADVGLAVVGPVALVTVMIVLRSFYLLCEIWTPDSSSR